MYSNDDTRTDILPRPNEKLPWKLRKASGMRMWPEASSKTCVNAILGILADAHLYAKHKNIFSGVSFCFCHELRQNFYHPIFGSIGSFSEGMVEWHFVPAVFISHWAWRFCMFILSVWSYLRRLKDHSSNFYLNPNSDASGSFWEAKLQWYLTL